MDVYRAFVLECCRTSTSGSVRGHHARKAFRRYLDTLDRHVSWHRSEFHAYLAGLRGVDYDPTLRRYRGLSIDRSWMEDPGKTRASNKRRLEMNDESSSEPDAPAPLLVSPMLFVDRTFMPPIVDKMTVTRDELFLYARWCQEERARLASYAFEDQTDRDVQQSLLAMLDQEKLTFEQMYQRPRSTAVTINQIYFTAPLAPPSPPADHEDDGTPM